MSPPINFDGSEIQEATIDGQDVSEITIDGQQAADLSGIPDSVIYQTESADSTTITEAAPYSVIAVAAFDNDESGNIWRATTASGGDISLEDKGSFDLNAKSTDFADLEYGSVSESGLIIITTTFTNSTSSKIFVNGNGGEFDTISVPDLDGKFIADDGYSNTFEEVLVYNEDINATGTQDDEEQRLADKYGIAL